MGASSDSAREYEVILTDEALYGYSDVRPDSVYERISELIKSLARFPYYGQEYDPYYVAAKPDIPCRVFFCGNYGIYYFVDESTKRVTVLSIEDERRNPAFRFSWYYHS